MVGKFKSAGGSVDIMLADRRLRADWLVVEIYAGSQATWASVIIYHAARCVSLAYANGILHVLAYWRGSGFYFCAREVLNRRLVAPSDDNR